jgi:uncharacterized protein YjdB
VTCVTRCQMPKRSAPRCFRAMVLLSLAGCGREAVTKPLPRVPVATVTVTPSTIAIIVGTTHQFAAMTRDSTGAALDDRVVQWSTSDSSRATVSATGLVTGVADGIVRINASTEGRSGFANAVVVTLPVASVALSPLAATVQVGRTVLFTAKPLSNTGQVLPGQRAVTWLSSDPSKVIVDASGLVTAVGAGTATVTATCEGQSSSAVISVVP